MTAVTKARTEGQKRRDRAERNRKAMEAVCAISGVQIAAGKDEPSAARKTAQEQAAARDERLKHRCQLLGIPATEVNCKLVAGAEWASLHGRMWLHAQAQRPEDARPWDMDEDAYQGIEYYRIARDTYRRDVLGQDVPRYDDHARAPLSADDIEQIEVTWRRARAVLDAQGRHAATAVVWVLAAPESVQPRHVTAGDRRALRLAGHQLARHFGVRL